MPGFVCEERLTFGPWAALERAIARLISHAGFQDVNVVGGAGDEGGDVVGTTAGKRWVFQSKYRYSGGADASGAREVVRAMSAYEATTAVAATNTYFTDDAYQFQSVSKANNVDLRLWNGAHLLKYFDKLPDRSAVLRELRPY